MLFVDGASNIKGNEAGIILEGPDGLIFKQSLHFNFKASNNQAEYEALIVGLNLEIEMEAARVVARSDSQLVTNQFKDEFQVKDPQLSRYLNKVRTLAECFEYFEIEYIHRNKTCG